MSGFNTVISAESQFNSVQDTDSLLRDFLSAESRGMGRFLVRQDFSGMIGDYLYEHAPLWLRLIKEASEADLNKEITMTALPTVGFSNKQDLSTTPGSPSQSFYDLTDPGQENKSVSGFIEWSHYARSLYEQQGRPYGDQVARDTDKMLVSAAKTLERGIVQGSVAVNPLSFNGFQAQMPASGHVFTLDLTVDEPTHTLYQYLGECLARISSSRLYDRKTTDIIVTGAGWALLQKEIEDRRVFMQDMEVLPGLRVPAILTTTGKVPITQSRYLDDTAGATANDPDVISYHFLDLDEFVWRGVVPLGGKPGDFNPQVFDITSYANGVPLTEKRMTICYGTPFAKNRGQSIYRLDVRVPHGTAWVYTA